MLGSMWSCDDCVWHVSPCDIASVGCYVTQASKGLINNCDMQWLAKPKHVESSRQTKPEVLVSHIQSQDDKAEKLFLLRGTTHCLGLSQKRSYAFIFVFGINFLCKTFQLYNSIFPGINFYVTLFRLRFREPTWKLYLGILFLGNRSFQLHKRTFSEFFRNHFRLEFSFPCFCMRVQHQKPLNPRKTKKLQKKSQIAHPGLGPKSYQKNTIKIQNRPILGHFRDFFRILGAKPGVGPFVFFSYFPGKVAERSPNFSNSCPEFCPEFCSEFSPNIFEDFSCFVSWETETRKNSPKIPAIFQCKIHQANTKKIFTKFFWCARQSNFFVINFVLLGFS